MPLLAFERRWLLAIFDAILPSGAPGGLPLGAADIPMERFVADLWAHAPGESRVGVRLALWIVTLAPLVWRLKLRPFHRLKPADRAELLTRMGDSRFYVVRELPNLLKIVACMGWAAMPDVQRAAGLPHPETRRPDWAGEEP